MKTVILGAGLAGLSAADELARRGIDVVVIEKNPFPGGLASTVREGEFSYDLGPHRFHTSNAKILQYVSELPGISFSELERVSRIRLLDRYFDYPLAMGNVLSTMPIHRGAGMILSYLGEKLRGIVSPREQKSFEGWVLSRFGRGLYDLYLAPYNRKLWGIEPDRLSADWASQRITVPSLAGLVKETLFPSRETVRSLVSTFHYPEGGIGEISQALARRITGNGGAFLYSTSPSSVQRKENGWNVSLQDDEIACDFLVNTIPVNQYTELLGNELSEIVHSAAGALNFRSLVFLSVLVSGNIEPKDHWIYTSEDRYPFNRLSISRNFDEKAPSQVVFEFGCQAGDETWGMAGEELLRITVPGAEHLGLFSSNRVLGFNVSRASHAYPIYDLTYASNTACVLDALEKIPGSVTCGRQGLFRYNNMDHSIEMGRYAALEVLGKASVREHFNWDENTWADG